MPDGRAYWRGVDYFLSPYGNEFGNATPDNECFVAVYPFLRPFDVKKINEEDLYKLVEYIAMVTVHELGHAFGIVHNTSHPSVHHSVMLPSHRRLGI